MSSVHKNQAFHHDFTSKLPPKYNTFFQNPCKNTRKTAKKFAPAVLKFFLSNSTHQKPCQAESKIKTV